MYKEDQDFKDKEVHENRKKKEMNEQHSKRFADNRIMKDRLSGSRMRSRNVIRSGDRDKKSCWKMAGRK